MTINIPMSITPFTKSVIIFVSVFVTSYLCLEIHLYLMPNFENWTDKDFKQYKRKNRLSTTTLIFLTALTITSCYTAFTAPHFTEHKSVTKSNNYAITMLQHSQNQTGNYLTYHPASPDSKSGNIYRIIITKSDQKSEKKIATVKPDYDKKVYKVKSLNTYGEMYLQIAQYLNRKTEGDWLYHMVVDVKTNHINVKYRGSHHSYYIKSDIESEKMVVSK